MKTRAHTRHTYGDLLILTGFLLLVPLLVLPFFPEEFPYAWSFLIPALCSILLGGVIRRLKRPRETERDFDSNLKHSSLTVLFAWCYGFFAGAMPFVLSGQLSMVRALFESVSGFTTTGLSVLDVSKTPAIFLFHRSFMQYCGGLGFVMMMILLIQEKQSMNLFYAEGHPDQLQPNLKKTAHAICSMYLFFLAAGTAAYILAGMNVFESLLHAMCSLSTGGFSTRLGSIGEYRSVSIELVTVFLMLIGTTNFAALQLLFKRRWKAFFKISEIRFLLGFLLLAIPLLAVSLRTGIGLSWSASIRSALLDGVSALSTTGYSSMDYNVFPGASMGIMILLMLCGGGIGSTAGGLKLQRIYFLLRNAKETLVRKVSSPRRVTALHYYRAQGKTVLDHETIRDTSSFLITYLFIFIAGSLLIAAFSGRDLTAACFEFASALGTVGLSCGITGPGTAVPILVIEMAGMILGRLEIYLVLTGIYSLLHLKTVRRVHPTIPDSSYATDPWHSGI